jgi:hypothetical protein
VKEYRWRQRDLQELPALHFVVRGPAHPFRTTAQRIATFLTQEEFAERIGISENYLSPMERGKVEIGVEILHQL